MAIKHLVPDRAKRSIVIFDIRALWRSALSASDRMSKITNDGLTGSGTGCFIAVHIWQQWASKGGWQDVTSLTGSALVICLLVKCLIVIWRTSLLITSRMSSARPLGVPCYRTNTSTSWDKPEYGGQHLWLLRTYAASDCDQFSYCKTFHDVTIFVVFWGHP